MKKQVLKKRSLHTGSRLTDALAAGGLLKDAEATAIKRVVAFSSGNVFKDLNLPNADERQTKVQLAVATNRLLSKRRLSKAKAAEVLRVNQIKVSALQEYRLNGFSIAQLMLCLTALGNDVEISIKRRTRGIGRISVDAA